MIHQKSKESLHSIGWESRKEPRSSASHCMRKMLGIPGVTWSNPLNPIYAKNGNRLVLYITSYNYIKKVVLFRQYYFIGGWNTTIN